jgi:soluble lytic murein transglycosylase-like protein
MKMKMKMKYNCWLFGLCVLASSLCAEPLHWVRVPVDGAAFAASGVAVETASGRALADLPSTTPTLSLSRTPAHYTELIAEVAAEHDIDPLLVQSVVAVESAYRHDAVSPKGAIGLMQLMPETAARYGKHALMVPRENLEAGVTHLGGLIQRFGRVELALAAYNAGEGAVARHGGVIPPYPETQLYVQKVLGHYKKLKADPSSRLIGENYRAAKNTPSPVNKSGDVGQLWQLLIGGSSNAADG